MPATKLPKAILNKIEVREELDYSIDIEGDLQTIIKEFNVLYKKYKEYDKLVIELNWSPNADYPVLIGYRLETDKEHRKRIEQYIKDRETEKRRKADEVAKEKETLIRLAKKHKVSLKPL